MIWHITAFVAGFLLDLLLGDPYSFPHPVRLIGRYISFLEERLLDRPQAAHTLSVAEKRWRGALLVLVVCVTTVVITTALLAICYSVHPVLGCTLEAVMTYQALALKCLRTESMKVYAALEHGTIEDARYAVSMIVGRDAQQLDGEQVAKAAVETVAENTSDGVIAPMLYLAIGGPVLGFLYKSINTMDSMIGYKNDKYIDFGRCAARLDDLVNFIPARISAIMMIAGCVFLGREYSTGEAWRIYKRDRRKHASPNSAQTEAACAGALGVRLAGDASYFGKVVKKPFLGDGDRPVTSRDIVRANRMSYATALLCEACCVAAMLAVVILTGR